MKSTRQANLTDDPSTLPPYGGLAPRPAFRERWGGQDHGKRVKRVEP